MTETEQKLKTNINPGAYSPHDVRIWMLWVLLLALVLAFCLSLSLGSVRIPLNNVFRILLGGVPDRATWATIVLKFRLPKALTAALAGAALAMSGLQMQTLFRNPLADPFILGISAGASLGVALVVLAVGMTGSLLITGIGFFGDFGLAVAATLGASLVLLLVLLVSRRARNTMTMLILGLMFSYATSAVVSLLFYFSSPERIQTYIAWTFGSFGGVTWDQMQVMAPILLLGLAIAFLLPKSLNALLLGEAYARSMGLNVRRARVWIIISSSLLAGVVTAFCGPIGFLGVAIPHMCRGIFHSSDHRILVPAATLLGATVALLADLAAQAPGLQQVLPLNAVTSLLGAPVVIWVLLRRQQIKETVQS